MYLQLEKSQDMLMSLSPHKIMSFPWERQKYCTWMRMKLERFCEDVSISIGVELHYSVSHTMTVPEQKVKAHPVYANQVQKA